MSGALPTYSVVFAPDQSLTEQQVARFMLNPTTPELQSLARLYFAEKAGLPMDYLGASEDIRTAIMLAIMHIAARSKP